jgi:hypothetical protein
MSVMYNTPIYSGYGDTSTSSLGGEIQIEEDRWQMITIPVIYGSWNASVHQIVNDGQTIATIKNYVFDQIADIMGGPVENYIASAHTYIGDNNYFYNYIPSVTNPLSSHNFPLAYDDEGRIEYVLSG